MLEPLDWPGFADVSLGGLLLLCAAAFAAGTIDAIVGGGGLLQLPALLLIMPGGGAICSLATNKLASIAGTTAASAAYARRGAIDWRSTLPIAFLALLGSVGGAVFADALPSEALNAVVLVAIAAVGVYTWRRPQLGVRPRPRFSGAAQLAVLLAGGALIGFWDGIAGPGTGSFLVFLLVGLGGLAFVNASATAKVVNAATNLGALLFFVPAGKVLWGLGLVMAVANMSGSVLGTAVATSRGSGFIRRVFLTVVVGMLISLGWKFAASV